MNKQKGISTTLTILLIVLLVVIVGGGVVYKYYLAPGEEVTETKTTRWKKYILEEISEDFKSPDFYDRRLVGVQDNGQHDIIISSIKEALGEPKENIEWYPKEVSFPSYSSKIFFVKHLSETGHSMGLIMFDVKLLTFKELTETGKIYQDYYNYESLISPDGFKIASLGYNELYLLDLLNDEAKLLAKAKTGEVFDPLFWPAKENPDFVWLDNNTIQYPVYSSEKIYDSPIEIRQISINEINETAGWKTYRNEKYGFEFKYPEDWELSETFSSLDIPSYYGIKAPEQQFSPIEVKIHKEFDESYIREHYPEFYWGTNVGCNLIIITSSEISENFNRNFEKNLAPYGQAPIEKIKIGKENAIKYHPDTAPGSGELRWLLKDGKGIGFISSCSPECNPVIDQILSTFRFLE